MEANKNLKALEDQLKQAYKADQMSTAEGLAEQLVSADPKNRLATKILEKIKAGKVDTLEDQLKQAFKANQSDAAQKYIADLRALDPENRYASKIEKKLASKGAEAPKVATQSAPEKSGNVFTSLFAQGKEPAKSESIIETIVSQSDKTKEVKSREEKIRPVESAESANLGEGFLKFSRAFFQFTFGFVMVSAAFFYVMNIDTQNRVLGLFEKENPASQLHGAATEVDRQEKLKQELEREIARYQAGYNNQFENIIQSIIDQRVDWFDIWKKINEVTESVYEQNALSQYVQFDSFSLDKETGDVRISGTLSDPLGRNLAKLLELEQAFRNYPRDISNPDDKTEPYFKEVQEFKSVSKTFDRQTGKYVSNFQLTFSLR